MTDAQWNELIEVIDGKEMPSLPVGFIVDSTWLPHWAGVTILDYYTSETIWFETNNRLLEEFPEVWIFPGYWAEFGMFSEPSAFGTKCVWAEEELPFPERCIRGYEEIASITEPNVEKDGMLPFMIKRLSHYRQQIEQRGHRIRFAISRGPLNIATFLLGGTEFLLGLKIEPKMIKKLLEVISDFTIEWLRRQKSSFPTIEGIFILDDIVGFISEEDFKELAYPYLKEIFGALDVPVKFLHNDASGIESASYLSDIGVNMFNFSHEHELEQMRSLTNDRVTLVGNIPPRDVLDLGSSAQIVDWVEKHIGVLEKKSRLIVSCGGGLSPGTSDENLRAFIQSARNV